MKGGGVKGIAFSGAVEVLERYFDFHTCVGTSAGGLAAILVGAKFSGKELGESLKELDFRQFTDRGFLSGIGSLLLHGGWHSGDYCHAWIRSMLTRDHSNPALIVADKSKRMKTDGFPLKDFQRRIVLIATSEKPESPVIIFDSRGKRGDICAAVAARCSMSIPLFFVPISDIDNLKILDGGLRCNFPVKEFKETCGGGDFIGLYLAPSESKMTKISALFRRLLGGNRGLAGALVAAFKTVLNQEDVEILRKHRESIIIIDPSPVETVDFSLNEDAKELLVMRGKLAALKWLLEFHSDSVNVDQVSSELALTQTHIAEIQDHVRTKPSRKKRVVSVIIFIVLLAAGVLTYKFSSPPQPGTSPSPTPNSVQPAKPNATMTPDNVVFEEWKKRSKKDD